MSVPRPRAPGLDLDDSALLDTLLREAPIGFAFFGSDQRFRRVNQTLAQLAGLAAGRAHRPHPGGDLAGRAAPAMPRRRWAAC